MLSSELVKVIRKLELQTRKLVSGPLVGDYKNKLKGSGFDFNQLREYEQGDDIRFIDWKSSARYDKLLVKQYLDDRNRTVILAVDLSYSMQYSSKAEIKLDLTRHLAGIMAFLSLYNKDSVGLLLFTDQVELFLLPRSGRSHIITIAKTLLTYEPKSGGTNINTVLKFINKMKSKKSILCIFSDFMDKFDESALSVIAKKHDLLIFRCLDEREKIFIKAGVLTLKDIETFKEYEINTNSKMLNYELSQWWQKQDFLFKSKRIDFLNAFTSRPFITDLIKFLNRRIGIY